MRLRELTFGIGRKLGKRPITSRIFCVTERALPLHRLARSQHSLAFCHPKPVYSPHVLVVPTTPLPSFTHAKPHPGKKAALLWEMIQLARHVTADQETDWCLVINGGARQEIGQLHGHLIHDDLKPPAYSVAIIDPGIHFGGWEHVFRWAEAAQRDPDKGYSVKFRLLPNGEVTASFSESDTS